MEQLVEKLKIRIAELEKTINDIELERVMLADRLNAYFGARQEAQHILTFIENM